MLPKMWPPVCFSLLSGQDGDFMSEPLLCNDIHAENLFSPSESDQRWRLHEELGSSKQKIVSAHQMCNNADNASLAVIFKLEYVWQILRREIWCNKCERKAYLMAREMPHTVKWLFHFLMLREPT